MINDAIVIDGVVKYKSLKLRPSHQLRHVRWVVRRSKSSGDPSLNSVSEGETRDLEEPEQLLRGV